MRWKLPATPMNGDTRERRGFLLLPREIDCEVRWLELAAWVETYIVRPRATKSGTYSFGVWEGTEWL